MNSYVSTMCVISLHIQSSTISSYYPLTPATLSYCVVFCQSAEPRAFTFVPAKLHWGIILRDVVFAHKLFKKCLNVNTGKGNTACT